MTTFRVLEAARAVADEINALLASRRISLLHRGQLRDAAQSVPANIREGMGRKPGPDRNQAYRFARGSAEKRTNISGPTLQTVVYQPRRTGESTTASHWS